MSQTLIVEVSDDVYAAIERRAREARTSSAHIVTKSLEQQFRHSRGRQSERQGRSEAEAQAARARFERHIGDVDLGYATGVDNERSDADLTREYADPHAER